MCRGYKVIPGQVASTRFSKPNANDRLANGKIAKAETCCHLLTTDEMVKVGLDYAWSFVL